MTKLPIEKGVPIPALRQTYPFSELAVGESFLVPFGDKDPTEVGNRVGSAVSAHKKRREPHKNFTRRLTNQGVRVWRTS